MSVYSVECWMYCTRVGASNAVFFFPVVALNIITSFYVTTIHVMTSARDFRTLHTMSSFNFRKTKPTLSKTHIKVQDWMLEQ